MILTIGNHNFLISPMHAFDDNNNMFVDREM